MKYIRKEHTKYLKKAKETKEVQIHDYICITILIKHYDGTRNKNRNIKGKHQKLGD